MPRISRQTISRLSRDRSFLLRTGLGIMAVSCALGWLLSMMTTAGQPPSNVRGSISGNKKLTEFFEQRQNLDVEQTAQWVRQADQIMLLLAMQQAQQFSLDGFGRGLSGDDGENGSDLIMEAPLPLLEKLIADAGKVDSSERMLLLNLARGLYGEEADATTAMANLKQSALMEPAVRFANEFYADVLFDSKAGSESAALQHYLREAELFEAAEYARQRVVRIMVLNKDRTGLQEIYNNPRYKNSLDAHSRIEITAILHDWLGLARAVLRFDYDRSSVGPYLISLFAGGIWLVIIGQFAGFKKRQVVIYAAALILGILSASATLFAVVIHHDVRGFTLEGDIWHQLVYCIAGIGLREETIKLLFFVPLIPILRKRPEIDGLVVASFVGLGFAVQENVGYYLGEGFSPWSRFFTANFFHLAVTGILGMALLQFARWPRTRWEELLATLIAAIVIHGLYDAFLMIPELARDLSILSVLIISLIAYRFFDQAEHLASAGRSRALSPLGVFVLGAALLGGLVMIFSCWGVPFRSALSGFLASGLGLFPVVFIFINRFRDA